MTRAATLKMPLAFETVDRFSCVSTLVTSTVAPGIGSPCSSCTIPVMVPVEMACCAEARPADAASSTPTATPARAARPLRTFCCTHGLPPARCALLADGCDVSLIEFSVEFNCAFVKSHARLPWRDDAGTSGGQIRSCRAPGQFVVDPAEDR